MKKARWTEPKWAAKVYDVARELGRQGLSKKEITKELEKLAYDLSVAGLSKKDWSVVYKGVAIAMSEKEMFENRGGYEEHDAAGLQGWEM